VAGKPRRAADRIAFQQHPQDRGDLLRSQAPAIRWPAGLVRERVPANVATIPARAVAIEAETTGFRLADGAQRGTNPFPKGRVRGRMLVL
jgi:hypothetical protein